MIELRDYVIKFDHTAIGVPNIQDALPLYRDLLGWANQRFAGAADEVIWMVAGIAVPIGGYRR